MAHNLPTQRICVKLFADDELKEQSQSESEIVIEVRRRLTFKHSFITEKKFLIHNKCPIKSRVPYLFLNMKKILFSCLMRSDKHEISRHQPTWSVS